LFTALGECCYIFQVRFPLRITPTLKVTKKITILYRGLPIKVLSWFNTRRKHWWVSALYRISGIFLFIVNPYLPQSTPFRSAYKMNGMGAFVLLSVTAVPPCTRIVSRCVHFTEFTLEMAAFTWWEPWCIASHYWVISLVSQGSM